MKTNYLVKIILASVLIIWVATGNASFTGKCCKKSSYKTSEKTIRVKVPVVKHFSPLDVVKW